MTLQPAALDLANEYVTSAILFVATVAATLIGGGPMRAYIRNREAYWGRMLHSNLMLKTSARAMTVLCAFAMIVMGAIGYLATTSMIGVIAASLVGLFFPNFILRTLRTKRLKKLDEQLVAGVQTLASGVRAGLNLVQAMQLVAREGSMQIRQEFTHLLREYDYGVSLEEAMSNAAARIGSGDYRLLFAALATHRERGGDLGETLDRIAESIREIQRLESRVKSLTAQGRANARFLGLLVAVVMGVLYIIEPTQMAQVFHADLGKLILAAIIALLAFGFVWIRKIVAIDI